MMEGLPTYYPDTKLYSEPWVRTLFYTRSVVRARQLPKKQQTSRQRTMHLLTKVWILSKKKGRKILVPQIASTSSLLPPPSYFLNIREVGSFLPFLTLIPALLSWTKCNLS